MEVPEPGREAHTQPDRASLPADAGRRRLDLALSSVKGSTPGTEARRRIPGLRRELFPAAAWRRELDRLEDSETRNHAERVQREHALVTHSLAELRAEDILQRARSQARRLVGTAAAVARARREQAERAAEATLAEAEETAAATLLAARKQAEGIVAESGADVGELNERLLRLRAALEDAETKLGAFSESTRKGVAANSVAIDLEEEQRIGERQEHTADVIEETELVMAADTQVRRADVDPPPQPVYVHDDSYVHDEAYGASVPRVQVKGRFTVPGLTPDRIEALRDELAP